VRDRERERGVGDEVHGVAEVRGDARRRLAALLRLDAGDREAAHAEREEPRLERGAREAVARVLQQHRLVGLRGEEVHELQVRAVAPELGVVVRVQEVEHRTARGAMGVDEGGDVRLERAVAAAGPPRRGDERVLRVDDEQGGLVERDGVGREHRGAPREGVDIGHARRMGRPGPPRGGAAGQRSDGSGHVPRCPAGADGCWLRVRGPAAGRARVARTPQASSESAEVSRLRHGERVACRTAPESIHGREV
jgi:hypothetical protein